MKYIDEWNLNATIELEHKYFPFAIVVSLVFEILLNDTRLYR